MSYFQKHHEARAQRSLDQRERPPANLKQCPKCTVPLLRLPPQWRTLYRCGDCHQVKDCCRDCILKTHEERPFDRIYAWSDESGFWQKKTVADLGHVWYLGHGGDICDTNRSNPRPMVFVHEHGIMDLPVKFCQCIGALMEPEQLLEHGCWPATWREPHTAITLNVMRSYHGLELQGQLNVHDFLAYLRRATDGTEPQHVKDRYREFNNSMCEFRHVRARHRHGVLPGRTLKRGDLVVLCPACPHPSVNMRPRWQERDREYRYTDALHYGIDGNFHLGSKAKATDEKDTALSKGAAYFVNTKDFKTYLKHAPKPPQETSECNQFDAIGSGKYKGKVSGVVGLTCRHMFMLGGCIVDLVTAEGYRYVDFALLSALQDYMYLRLLMGTYDIHCQYVKNLRKRLREQFGVVLDKLDSITETELPELVAGVGKYHLCMHKEECRFKHSLHYLPGAGMTDGETLERVWAVTNAIARRTKEMSAGHRHDVLNDHYSDLNVRRVHNMVSTLVEKLDTALDMASLTAEYLAGVEKELDKAELAAWRKQEREWKQKVVDIKEHKTLDNPYEPPRDAPLSSQMILQQLQDASKARGQPEGSQELSVVQSILSLRAERCGIRSAVLAYGGDEKARSKLASQLESFRERAVACRELHETRLEAAVKQAVVGLEVEVYPPGFPGRNDDDDRAFGVTRAPLTPTETTVLAFRKKSASNSSKKAQDILEMLDSLDHTSPPLPSDYHSAVRFHPAMTEFVKIERALHEGQANEALDELRLHITTHLSLQHRKQQESGVKNNTVNDRRLQEKREVINATKGRYRELRGILLVLGMEENHKTYKVLDDDDCKAFTLYEGEKKLGDSYKLPTWIWGDFSFARKLPPGDIKNFVKGAMRSHWFRHSALKTRWEEEVNTRLEEMFRTWTFFGWQEELWLARARAWEADESPGAAVLARRYVH
ncbi:hypothetical protein OH77DRAFT_1415382 [Trametes cingulata]|nr:hypothetical protein OH77DRAFT_1415382 [Trametes cingulata]